MHADQHRRSMYGLLLGLQRHSILNKCGSLASLTLVRILLQQYGVPSRDQQNIFEPERRSGKYCLSQEDAQC